MTEPQLSEGSRGCGFGCWLKGEDTYQEPGGGLWDQPVRRPLSCEGIRQTEGGWHEREPG